MPSLAACHCNNWYVYVMYMYLVNKLSLSPNWTRNYAPFTPPKTTRRDETVSSRRVASGDVRYGSRGRYIHRKAEKNKPIFFRVHLFSTWQKRWFFFAYIRPKESGSISYNSVYLILACVEKFAATVSLHILYMFTSQVMKLMITG